MSSENQNQKQRRRYTPEFKVEAIRLAKLKGVPTAAMELGINDSQLYGWRLKAKAYANSHEQASQLTAEVARLKRRVAEQEEELAILKKAATYFARNQK